jgi:hypothetical protein
MRFKAVTLGLVLAGTALGSAALTLGRARGAAWIGQPLDLLVPVQIEAGQAESTLCAEADVFHGDSRQESNRVQIVVSPTDQPDTFNLKITSSALVDEPVVTVYVRAGCSQKSTRKYVLLADFPTENAALISRTAAPQAAQVPLLVPVQTAPFQATPVAPPPQVVPPAVETPKVQGVQMKPRLPNTKQTAKSTVGGGPKNAVREVSKEPALKKGNPAKPVEAAPSASTGKPRLRLDPLETLNERVKTLESSTTAATAQEDLARDAQKMEALQGDLKTLLEQATKNEANLVAMRERLEKAESERVPVALVYALLALVVLCLGALVFLWTRRPRNPDWDNSVQPGSSDPRGASASGPAGATPSASRARQDMHVDLVDMDDESFDRLMGQAEARK